MDTGEAAAAVRRVLAAVNEGEVEPTPSLPGPSPGFVDYDARRPQ